MLNSAGLESLKFEDLGEPPLANSFEIKCQYCLSFADSPQNQIVLCDKCNGAVHQNCYGFPLETGLPSDSWYCYRCQMHLLGSLEIERTSCYFCGKKRGIMKNLLVSEEKTTKNAKIVLAHGFCARWFDGFEQFDAGKFEAVVKDLKEFRKRFNKKKCGFCGKTSGYCLKCGKKPKSPRKTGCNQYYHPICARENGVIFGESINFEVFGRKNGYSLCPEHFRRNLAKKAFIFERKSRLFAKETTATLDEMYEAIDFLKSLRVQPQESLKTKKIKEMPKKVRKFIRKSRFLSAKTSEPPLVVVDDVEEIREVPSKSIKKLLKESFLKTEETSAGLEPVQVQEKALVILENDQKLASLPEETPTSKVPLKRSLKRPRRTPGTAKRKSTLLHGNEVPILQSLPFRSFGDSYSLTERVSYSIQVSGPCKKPSKLARNLVYIDSDLNLQPESDERMALIECVEKAEPPKENEFDVFLSEAKANILNYMRLGSEPLEKKEERNEERDNNEGSIDLNDILEIRKDFLYQDPFEFIFGGKL